MDCWGRVGYIHTFSESGGDAIAMPPSLSAGRGWRGSDGRGTPRHLCIVLALAVFGVTECDAAGGVTIFEVGQAIDMRPWPVLAMYIMVIIVSVFYELLTHHIEHVVTSRSGKAIVAHVYKEVMILGGISLLLTILENSGGDLLFEPVFYHYVHFVIFFMAINLISGISCLFLFINRSWRKWLFFETTVTGIEHDPRLTLDERHAVLNQYVKRCPDGHKMLACVLFFRSNPARGLQTVQLHPLYEEAAAEGASLLPPSHSLRVGCPGGADADGCRAELHRGEGRRRDPGSWGQRQRQRQRGPTPIPPTSPLMRGLTTQPSPPVACAPKPAAAAVGAVSSQRATGRSSTST